MVDISESKQWEQLFVHLQFPELISKLYHGWGIRLHNLLLVFVKPEILDSIIEDDTG